MKKSVLFLLVIVILSTSRVFAQENEANNQTKINPFQFSFFTPIGTNGINSWNVTNRVSINIIVGYSGGLKGVEVGCISNNIKGDMNGLQLVGYSNVVLGKSKGAQVSGFSNVTKKSTKGFQVSGYSNVALDSAEVVQISGYSNVIKGSNKGFQITGYSNYAGGYTKGAQISGFSNIVKGDAKVIQVSGFSNVTTGNLSGLQLASFFNYAKKLNGFQIGFVNICDSISRGVPIGFFSFVRKGGYHTLEIGADETLWGQLSFKTGVNAFYNIFSAGAKMSAGNVIWGWGYGIGTKHKITPKMDANLDIVAYHIKQDNYLDYYVNMLNKVKLNVSWKFNDRLTAYGGLTYNILLTDRTDNEGKLLDNNIAPWKIYDKENDGLHVIMYPGLTAGIRIF
jgi:hypothetical protein